MRNRSKDAFKKQDQTKQVGPVLEAATRGVHAPPKTAESGHE